jgi:hypothetical protein
MTMLTTIKVYSETMERLKSRKLAKRDSYDEVINRALDKLEKIEQAKKN